MRRSRERRRKGLRCIPFKVHNREIENLIKLELLDPTRREDGAAIAGAMETLVDKIPFAWWAAAVGRPSA